MKKSNKIYGSLIALGFCLVTLPTAFLLPDMQISAIFTSKYVSDFVQTFLVGSDSSKYCSEELIWVCSIYLLASVAIAMVCFLLLRKRMIGLLGLIVLLGVEFYILQTPFFIFEVGTFYNCESDGQAIMALMSSSPKVSLGLIGFGVVYDIVKIKGSKINF